MATTAQLTEIISYNSNAIGFGGVAYAKAARRVRVATEKAPLGLSANPHDKHADQYPLNRQLFFYIDPDAVSPDLKRFVRWVLGEEGQSIVEGVGYYPLAPRERVARLAILGWQEKEQTPRSRPTSASGLEVTDNIPGSHKCSRVVSVCHGIVAQISRRCRCIPEWVR